jgi:hypothetical protein
MQAWSKGELGTSTRHAQRLSRFVATAPKDRYRRYRDCKAGAASPEVKRRSDFPAWTHRRGRIQRNVGLESPTYVSGLALHYSRLHADSPSSKPELATPSSSVSSSRALTHKSYSHEAKHEAMRDNETFEFSGTRFSDLSSATFFFAVSIWTKGFCRR